MTDGVAAQARGWRRELPLLIPFAIALGFALRGRPTRAAAVAAIGLVVLALRVVAGADRFHRGMKAVGHVAERLLAVLGTTTVWVLAVAPAWAIGRLSRRRTPPAGWERIGSGETTRRPFGPPSPSVTSRSTLSRAAQGLGVVTLILLVNLLVGLAWERVSPQSPATPMTDQVGRRTGPVEPDPRADGDALRDTSWGEQHLIDLQRMPYTYWPLVVTRPLDFASETITIRGWERASYRPADLPQDAPQIALYGGSAAFGEGQRDEGTIASNLARLAEDAGLPVEVSNYGQRGFVAWQDSLLFEQVTAEGDRPDLALFYDGGNEVATQTQPSTAGFPTHFDVDRISQTLTGTDAGGGARAEPQPFWSQAVQEYRDVSAVHRLGRMLGDLASGEPAGAQGDFRSADPEQVGRDALAVYERARSFIIDTAEARGISPVFYWQPLRPGTYEIAYETATEALSPPTLDISGILAGHDDVFLDGFHTNEEGAAIVARQMWEDLRPLVEDIYAGRAPRAPTTDETLRGGRSVGELETAQAELRRDLLPDLVDLGDRWTVQVDEPGSFVPDCAAEQDPAWDRDVTTRALSPILARSDPPPLQVAGLGLRSDSPAAAESLFELLSAPATVECLSRDVATATSSPAPIDLRPISPALATVAQDERAWRGVGADGVTEYLLVVTRDGADVGVWLVLAGQGVSDAELAELIAVSRS